MWWNLVYCLPVCEMSNWKPEDGLIAGDTVFVRRAEEPFDLLGIHIKREHGYPEGQEQGS